MPGHKNFLPSPFTLPPNAVRATGTLNAGAYAEAWTLARALRCSNRRCFLRRMTLNRSKSVRAFRRSPCSFLLAQLLSFHFASMPAFSHAALTVPVRAARGSLGMTKGANRTSVRRTACRGTTSLGSDEGPSTRA